MEKSRNYNKYGYEKLDNGFVILKIEEETNLFEYIGKVVINEDKVVFSEFTEDKFQPIQAIYTEPDDIEIRLRRACSDLVYQEGMPQELISKFSDDLYGKIIAIIPE